MIFHQFLKKGSATSEEIYRCCKFLRSCAKSSAYGSKLKTRAFFLATDNNEPSGGRKFIYQLVDILNENGFDAYALHQKKGFRYTWFDNKTRIRYTPIVRERKGVLNKLKKYIIYYLNSLVVVIRRIFEAKNLSNENGLHDVRFTKRDILVVPESRGAFLDEILPGIKKIILNQGPFLGFSKHIHGRNEKMSPYFSKEILGIIVLSELNYRFQKFVFPQKKIYKMSLYIDEEIFYYSNKKKPQIVFMPRRGADDATALINMLKFRDNLKEFVFKIIDNMKEDEVAKMLRESQIFLTFATREGFGLPAAEAMACGAIVIGFSGCGGDEFFKKGLCYKIPDGNLITFATVIEEVIDKFYEERHKLITMGKQASEFVLNKYSKEKAEREIVETWNKIISDCNYE